MSQSTSHPSSSCGSNCSSPAPLPYNQPTSLSDFPGATTPHAPHTSHQACLDQHSEAGLATGSTSSVLPQAPNLSLGRKRVAEDLEDQDHDTKRIKMESDGISPSPEIDTPSDACESHCGDDCGQLAAEGAQPSCSAACQGSVSSPSSASSTSSASATVVGASTVLFTSSVTITSKIAPDSSLPDTTLTETTEETTNSDSWTDDEVQDPAIVSSQPQLREFASAGMRREFNIWRWINEVEDPEDPVLPIFEPVSSVLSETMLTEAAEDPDVWQLIIENFMDPSLPPCESLADAAEDPDFCKYPIRTLLIGSWLNSSR